MPAHCTNSAVGVARLSDGNALTDMDLLGNDTVDKQAKAAARQAPPSHAECNLIIYTSKLVRDIAQWIGRCTVLANHFPITDPDGGKRFIRDSDAKRRVALRTTRVMKPPSVGAIKPAATALPVL